MYTPPLSARGSVLPRPCAPPGLVESLPGELTLDSITQQTPPGSSGRSGIQESALRGLSDEEKKEAFLFSCRKHLGMAYRSIECEHERVQRYIEG